MTYNGSATAPTNPGSYTVIASLTNDNYQAANTTGTLVISKRPTSVSASDVQVPFGSLVVLDATLTDVKSGTALTGKTLIFKVNGQQITNPYEALLAHGTYPIEVSFAGDDFYATSTATAKLIIFFTPGKITGGGSIDSGVRNFGFTVQTKSANGTLSSTGNLEFQDKARGINLHATAITGIGVESDQVHAAFIGTASVNGVSGYTFIVYVEDNAEPGAGVDKFQIQIAGPNGFSYDSSQLATKGGVLDQGGNIQVHRVN